MGGHGHGHGQCLSPQPGEWMKGKLVGSGSFGSVHLAMNKGTGALFVVKCSESEAGLKFLENEANILEKLTSPYIVQCIGKDVSNIASRGSGGETRLHLFMEYMCGGSLADVAEKFGGVLDERVIRLYTKEILQGLKYLHKNGIVHCDLKCKNVLLGSCGNIKLADFGCATDLNEMCHSTHSCKSMGGTPLWMAPEVLRNEGLDFSADIWSLGCTVIEMATGRPPWADEVSDNPMAAVLNIACRNGLPQFPLHFSKQGLDFLAKCLERNPKRRWTSDQLLTHPFVTGELSLDTSNSGKEDVCSPASVFDIRVYEDNSEDESSCHVPTRIPLLIMQSGRRKSTVLPMLQQTESDLGSSGTWVTVRSG